jgi:hypothetical protein
MTDAFGCDPHVAAQLSGELARIRAELGTARDAAVVGTGSERVDRALADFHTGSSDSREAIGSLLDRASGLLRGLAEGTEAVDRGLVASLTEPALPIGAVAAPEPG